MQRAALALAAAILVLAVAAGYFLFTGGGEPTPVKASTITVGLSTFDVIEQFHDEVVTRGLKIDVVRFQIPPQSIDALIAGDVQLTVIPVELAAVTMLKGGDVYIIALDNMVNQAIIAPPDSPITSPADLKGKRVAAVVGSGTYYLFKSFMKELYGLNITEDEGSDVIIINVRPGEVLAELKKLEHARRMPRNCCAASSGRREAADGTPYACSQGLPVSSSPPPTLLVLYQPV